MVNNSEINLRDGAADIAELGRLYTQSDVYLLIDLAKWVRPALEHWVGRCEHAEQQLRDLREARRSSYDPREYE